MNIDELNLRLVRILGIPSNTQRAEVVIEVGQPPRVTIERLMVTPEGEIAETQDEFILVPAGEPRPPCNCEKPVRAVSHDRGGNWCYRCGGALA